MAYALDALGLAVLPVCIGVAVLRYRLFEIDRIISRVISYAIITAVLAGVFAGLVVLVTVVLAFKSSVAVAAATLVVAALFNPLRRRVSPPSWAVTMDTSHSRVGRDLAFARGRLGIDRPTFLV